MSTSTYCKFTGTSNPTCPHTNHFQAIGQDTAVYLCPQSVARIHAAVDGIQTLTAMLVQREAEADMELTPAHTFGPGVALGTLSSIACCAEFVQAAADGRILLAGARVSAGSVAHQHLEQSAMQAKRMEGGRR